jgi:imidazolonepropionase-like amidohydrolase
MRISGRGDGLLNWLRFARVGRGALSPKTPVKIAFGSDTFELPGSNAEELELLVKYGMTPLQALRAGTSVAAELLGLGSGIGSIERGKAADIVAVDGDPFRDMRALRNVAFVMKGGKVVRGPQ